MSPENIHTLSPVLLEYSKILFDEYRTGSNVVVVEEPATAEPRHDEMAQGFDGFLHYLTSAESNAMAPSLLDATHPLSDYFVSTSHNTYISGNQLYGKSSATAYAKVLERGCRCVEIDVWDGDADDDSSESEDGQEESGTRIRKLRDRFKKEMNLLKPSKPHASSDGHKAETTAVSSSQSRKDAPRGRAEPVVTHGHTATRDVDFRTVCETIRDHAFVNSDLPIVVSLEVHTSPAQQLVMVQIMRETWGSHLVDPDVKGKDEIQLPTLESLRRKVLIKVKYSSPAAAANKQMPVTPASAAKEPDSSEEESQLEPVKKGKIASELGSMGVYTKSCHFKSFDQPEARLPTHIFALSEKKLIALHKHDPYALFCHNRKYLMRAYPKGFRVSSSNLDPAPFWRQGVQFVALNWQYTNAAMMLNESMFNSTGGWVLKPEGYLSSHIPTSQASALDRGMLDLSVEFLAGQNIGSSDDRHLRLYARCELHIEDAEDEGLPDDGRSKDGQIKARTQIAQGGHNPNFGRQVVRFERVPGVADELSFLRIKVVHDDTLGRDDLIAWACFRISRLQQGVRVVHLHDTEGKPTNGILLVRIIKRMEMR